MQFFPKSLFILLFCLIQGFTFDLALSNFDSTNINICIGPLLLEVFSEDGKLHKTENIV